MTPISTRDRFARKPGLITTDLKSELILLDPDTEHMFSLNDTGRVVWRFLETQDVGSLARSLEAEFEVDRATALADVLALLEKLVAAGLIRPAAQ